MEDRVSWKTISTMFLIFLGLIAFGLFEWSIYTNGYMQGKWAGRDEMRKIYQIVEEG